MKNEAKLLPCPFCGLDGLLRVCSGDPVKPETFFIRCAVCKAQGPEAGDGGVAEYAWNRRRLERDLRTALLLYHEAWNGCEGDWHAAMKVASKEAEAVLYRGEKH